MISKIKKMCLLLLISLTLLPNSAYAYSDYIIASGKNIGIELNATGIIIVGTYDVGNSSPAKEAKLQTGDKIIKINGTKVNSIAEMINAINATKPSGNVNIKVTYLRGSKEFDTTLSLIKDKDDVLKTGLYVKDSINGVGTLTFIDPNTKLYGALGHEIIEKSTGQKLEIKSGKIYESTVTGIVKSNDGNPGEKNARSDSSKVYGNVNENTTSGIFGKYTSDIPSEKLYKVANEEEVKLGEASILTVVENDTVSEFKINILKINDNKNSNKNLLFEIVDENLLNIAGGIVQGMSGSPIIQNDYIIGAVTHVVVDDTSKGYGIFITTMLEEAEN